MRLPRLDLDKDQRLELAGVTLLVLAIWLEFGIPAALAAAGIAAIIYSLVTEAS